MKAGINRLISGLTGYQLTRSSVDSVEILLTSPWFRSFGFNTVIDAGANSGQFARSARAAFPDARIYSFEPIPREYEKLKEGFHADQNFQAFQYALGDRDSSMTFRVNDFSPTSSLLNQTKLQKEYYPVTGETTELEIEVKRLDEVMNGKPLNQNVLLKIDVQGFEDKVILGSSKILHQIAMIYVECSFKEFYEGQPLFQEINALLYSKGFEFRGVGDQLSAGLNAEPTQIDGIFVNEKLVKKE